MKSCDMTAIGAKIDAGGILDFRKEFCPWAGISAVTGYEMISTGRVVTAKIGRKRVITAPNAIAFREALNVRKTADLETDVGKVA